MTVFAAASLTNAMQDIARAYKKAKNVEVVSSFASSSTLARQIEAGAPADLFISADQKWMDYAADKGHRSGDPRHPAWQQHGSGGAESQRAITIDEKTDWTNLLKGAVWRWAIRSTFRQVSTPKRCRNWAQETLSPKLAPAEDVRGALALVERSEAPLGIVYGSDAVASKG